MRLPTRTTIRTVLQTTFAIAVLLPELVDAIGLPTTLWWVAGALTVAGAVTRVMALPVAQRRLGPLRTDRPDDGVEALARRDRT